MNATTPPTIATRNACKLCAPLGAAVVFSGIERCVPFLHGSQGCATYIRRYLISHFREPVDIASSSFSEQETVFGGAENLKTGLLNVSRQYQPAAIGVATTCLAETIGEDVPRILSDHREACRGETPPLIHVSTPSYAGTHVDGFHATVRAVVEQLATPGPHHDRLNILPGFLSTEDLRHLKELLHDLNLGFTLLPDYSATLDGQTWAEFQRLQPGGTTLDSIRAMSGAPATIEFGRSLAIRDDTAASRLEAKFSVSRVALGTPIGLGETDRFFEAIERLTGRTMPMAMEEERGRLVDALVDGHKYVFGKRAAIFGDPDLVIGIASFLCEIGVQPVLCATGGKAGVMERCLREVVPDADLGGISIVEGADHARIAEHIRALKPDLLLGSSKGYPIARELGVPLIRVGFPIHDRLGGQRLLHIGYRGAQRLYDQIINTLLDRVQTGSEVGYSYL